MQHVSKYSNSAKDDRLWVANRLLVVLYPHLFLFPAIFPSRSAKPSPTGDFHSVRTTAIIKRQLLLSVLLSGLWVS